MTEKKEEGPARGGCSTHLQREQLDELCVCGALLVLRALLKQPAHKVPTACQGNDFARRQGPRNVLDGTIMPDEPDHAAAWVCLLLHQHG